MIFLQFSISVLLGVISVHGHYGMATLTEQRTMEVDMSADNYRYVAYHHKATCKPRLCNGSLVVLCACKGELTSLSSLMSGHLRIFLCVHPVGASEIRKKTRSG